MKRFAQRWIAWIVCSVTTAAAAADGGLTIEPREKWSGVFADSNVALQYVIAAEKSLDARLGWRFIIDQRTVGRGEIPVKIQPGGPVITTVRLRIPHVKEGVIVEGQLEVAVSIGGTSRAAADHVRPLRIFPRNPFVDQSKRLEAAKITLFDPQRDTGRVFEKMGIPFSETGNVDSLKNRHGGILVIGEGTSFADYRGLPKIMVEAAARGVAVLCLAPSGGEMALPGTEGVELPQPKSLTLRRSDVIRDLDKRLDATAWPADAQVVATSLALKSDRDRLVAEVVEGAAGWPWIEADFPAKRGKLVVCGFGIVQNFDVGPTPRFLLARLIEYLDAETSPTNFERRTR